MVTDRRQALVTGGAQRVGRAIVEKLIAEGFDVVFTYHSSRGAADELVDRLSRGQRRCVAVQVELGEVWRSEMEIRQAVEVIGRLDLLVNNASMYEPDPNSVTYAFSIHMNAVNVEAPVQLVKWFAPMLRSSRGHVVNMLDLLAEKPWEKYATYCASKAALWNHTITMARALAPDVTVNGIAPGVVAWPEDFPESEREKYLKRVPLGRPGTPGDVASLVHFLATEGTYITGQVIRLDGGRSIT